MTEKFKTLEELENYFDNEKIECLICGRKLRSLCSHLKTHDMNSTEYKKMFGIPKRWGLLGLLTKGIKSVVGKEIASKVSKEDFLNTISKNGFNYNKDCDKILKDAQGKCLNNYRTKVSESKRKVNHKCPECNVVFMVEERSLSFGNKSKLCPTCKEKSLIRSRDKFLDKKFNEKYRFERIA